MYVSSIYDRYTTTIIINMTAVKHLISLSTEDGSEKIWKELFEGKEDFSGWIKSKLFEEKEKRLDKDYIYTKLAEIENKAAYWKKQLQTSEEIQLAKQQEICKEEPKTREQMERDFENLIKIIGAALEFRFLLKDDSILFNHDFLEDLAIEYSNGIPNQKLDDFLKTKGFTPKVLVRRELTI